MSVNMNKRVPRVAILGILCALLVPVPALAADVELTGRVVDAEQQPVSGYRVVYRETSTLEVFLGPPTDADGAFSVTVPAGGSYQAVALLSSSGRRIELPELPPAAGVAGTHQQIQVAALTSRIAPDVQRFPGGDRLFRSFVEDAVVTGRLRLEGQLEAADSDATDLVAMRAVVAYQFASIEDVEWGARAGFGDLDVTGSGLGGSGATDLDLWVKLHLIPDSAKRPDMGFGALVTLPTGDSDSGLGLDAISSKLFFAVRHSFNWFESGVFTANVGVRGTEDGELFGVPIDSKASGSGAIGLIWPLAARLTLILEAAVESKRFEGGDTDARLVGGVNWKPLPYGSFRLAASAGLADGAPDSQLLLGYSFDF